ncbi:hypothetical protein B0T17DRAFT_112318 [Bombardia bombarda]|uniref:Uncharacterized protein n=1 Tax=Bombardia bombarda TaxID=252184 RepID=A0AA39WBQ4_9PEZI|nr:hypothetical protein B0T17DRAFT_112318 [Bombardia bombarda]
MAAATPSSRFLRLANTWRLLALRSDVDDIILELLGHFSLEKIYAGPADRETYQRLVKALLAQLSTIFYIQRLTLPAENAHVGWYLGFLVSWEVTLRSIEFVLQLVNDGRESLWDDRQLRDKYLAEFLLSALRILALHPKAPANQRAKDRRDRFSRIHSSLEQVFDSYPGPKSFLLEVCREVTTQLHADPDALGLPPRLRYELPNLTSELYPLADCLSSPYISELVPQDDFAVNWLSRFLTLRDVSHFILGASIQYAANRESRNVRLQSSSARSRNAILHALENIRMPPNPRISRLDMVTTFSATFCTILPDTLDLSRRGLSESRIDEYELDALDTLCARLKERQIIHRMSDREMCNSVAQAVRNIHLQDDPGGQFGTARPSLYTMNCPQGHVAGGSQLRSSDIKFTSDPTGGLETRLPPNSRCLCCGEPITMIREVPIVRRIWELLRPLEPDADTINVERHLPSQFQLGPPRIETSGLFNSGYSNTFGPGSQRSHDTDLHPPSYQDRVTLVDATSADRTDLVSPMSPRSFFPRPAPGVVGTEFSHSDTSVQYGKRPLDHTQEISYLPRDPAIMTEPMPFSPDSLTFYRPTNSGPELNPMLSSSAETSALGTSRTVPLLTSPERSKSKWKLKFHTGSKKASVGVSIDSSSLSSTTLEAQKLEEISLEGLSSVSKPSARGKGPKNTNVKCCLSQNSTFALFWAQLSIHVWDVGTSPPTMRRAISTESTCILATVAKLHLAYIVGTRDQKLTLRIVNLAQPTVPVVEYRIPSLLWCKSIAIDRQENYVVVGFENATVRFFKTANTEQPREDRLHAIYHKDCKGCPSVDTLAFSSDGLVLLAGTRNSKNGIVQVYEWRFPFIAFRELTTCRYTVPLHESEDNGISSVIVRSGSEGEDNLICITTWTQSGTPVLVQPQDGHKSEIRTEITGRHSKLGSRIQCAVFSPSGKELAMVNDKGYLYQISNLNSSPMDIQKASSSKELTAKSDSFSMAFMTLSDEEHIVLAWADSSRAVGWIKKIPIISRGNASVPATPSLLYEVSSHTEIRAEVSGESREPPVELAATEQATSPRSTDKFAKEPPGAFEQKS